jgi:hypothetical protein
MFVKIQLLRHVGPFRLVHSYHRHYLHLLDLLVCITSSYLKLSYTAFRVTSNVNKKTLHSRQINKGTTRTQHTTSKPFNPVSFEAVMERVGLGYDAV